jgi:hypothetical protein
MKTAIGCAILLVVVVFLYERHPAFFNFLNTPATPAYGYNQQTQIDPQTGQPPIGQPYAYQDPQQPTYQQPVYQYPQPVVQPPVYQPPVYQYPTPVYQYPQPVPVCPPRPIYVQPYQPYKSVVVTPGFRSAFR